MKQFLLILLSLIVSALLAPQVAHAAQATKAATSQPTYIWHGPACYDGPVCSIDPPDPGQHFADHCYFSDQPNYQPNPIQLDSIYLCQATRNVLVVPLPDHIKAFNLFVAWALKFLAAAKADPDDAPVNTPAVVRDLINIRYDMKIYNAAPSAKTWQFVVQDLLDLGVRAEINN